MSLPWRIFGGWGALCRLYPDRVFNVERTFSESSASFSGSLLGHYNRCIDVDVGDCGIRLSVVVFSVGSFRSPIVLPWTAIECCTSTRFGLIGDGLRISVRDWPWPIIVGWFLWKYGDVCADISKRWQQEVAQSPAR